MPAWWQQRSVLRRFVCDLVADELARLRRSAVPRALPWPEDLRFDEDLGVDSLELMALGTALVEALHLHESGIEDYLLARRTVGDWVDVAATGLEHFSDRLTFRTSGSSGSPKPCQHVLANLRQETAHLATLFPQRRRILCAVPSHHIYGFLFSVLLPQAVGVAAEVVDLRRSTPAWLAHGAQAGDLVVGHPEFWAAVARTVQALPAGVEGVTSTAPCAPDVAQRVVAAGLSRLVQVYGASETGGIGARDAPGAPYELFPHWRFDPTNAQWLLRRTPDGGEQAHAPQDVLVEEGGRRFLVRGRHDHAVQVGGINVFPGRVREVLLRHPGVADASVRLMRPEEGIRLKAFVVPKAGAGGGDALLADLNRWIDHELATPERPKAIRFGARLPAGASGKPVDWPLDG